MGKPRVWEYWVCCECEDRRVYPYRTLSWTQKRGRELMCAVCHDWTLHRFAGDAPPPGAAL
jgi:hypothetical protein